MNKITFGVFCFIFAIKLFADEPTQEQKQAIFMMNYSQYVTYKLKTYNNIIALEEEYENLNDNMNFSTIQDYDSVTTINILADSIYNERKNHKNRERLEISIKNRMNQALYNSFPKITTITSGKFNPISLALNITQAAASTFFSYQQYKNELSNEYDEKMYQFQTLTEDILNNLYQDLNIYTYNLVQKYNISDEWRLNKTELENIFKYINDINAERRFKNLKDMSEGRYVQHFPMFWYHLAKAAADADDKEAALNYYTRFEKENIEIFRYDRTAVDAYKGKIILLLENPNKNKKEITKKLQFIETNKTSWNDFYYCALVYSRLNDNENAQRLLERNINELSAEVENQFLNAQNLQKIYEPSDFYGRNYYDGLELSRNLLKNIGGDAISDKSIAEQYANDTQAFNEVLYQFGLQTSSDLVYNSMESIKKICVSMKVPTKERCQIDAHLPMQWVMSSDSNLVALFYKEGSSETKRFPMTINEKELKKLKKKTVQTKDCNLSYTTGIIDIAWSKEGFTFGGILIEHSLYPIHLKYEIDINKPEKNKTPTSVYFNQKEYRIDYKKEYKSAHRKKNNNTSVYNMCI